jgi:hypothetical protein
MLSLEVILQLLVDTQTIPPELLHHAFIPNHIATIIRGEQPGLKRLANSILKFFVQLNELSILSVDSLGLLPFITDGIVNGTLDARIASAKTFLSLIEHTTDPEICSFIINLTMTGNFASTLTDSFDNCSSQLTYELAKICEELLRIGQTCPGDNPIIERFDECGIEAALA